jgi:diguanylate cyclase (GGDEF)-like protein/putative nucleotidyltransferase with HDIG domain
MSARADRDRLARELAAARERIAQLEAEGAHRSRDVLGGLISIESFRSHLTDELRRAQRHDLAGSLVVLRVDRMSDVHRDHGFKAGDAMLRAMIELLRSGTRAGDLLARTGDAEFALLLRQVDEQTAASCVVRLLFECERLDVGPVRGVPVSAGIADFKGGGEAVTLFDQARAALDDALAAGGGRAVVSSQSTCSGPEAVEQIQRRDAVEALAIALLERDRYTGEHSESVVAMAAAVARSLGLSKAQVDDVQAAALLHDIGKVGVPDAILNKPGPLTPEERTVMAAHPVIGERILRSIGGFGPVAEIVRHEHESFDGSGYPDRLSGDRIPIGSRIILACDAYHAMTSDRPYRARMSHADAFAELSRCAGRQFDPDVTAALIGFFYNQRAGRPAPVG